MHLLNYILNHNLIEIIIIEICTSIESEWILIQLSFCKNPRILPASLKNYLKKQIAGKLDQIRKKSFSSVTPNWVESGETFQTTFILLAATSSSRSDPVTLFVCVLACHLIFLAVFKHTHNTRFKHTHNTRLRTRHNLLDKHISQNRKSQILLGGHLTECMNLEQGVFQGDVISPYLFILMVYSLKSHPPKISLE